MTTLTLPLKRKWFDMILRGVKLEEYREIKPHWKNRFAFEPHEENWKNQDVYFYEFDKLVFTLGYPKADDTSRHIEFKNPKIRIGTGRPEWGAEPGKNYFVITWDRTK